MPPEPTIDAPAPEAAPKGSGGIVGAGLKRTVGPLPLWAWGLAVAIGIGIIILRRRRSEAPAEVTYAQAPAQWPTIGNAAGAGATPSVFGPGATPAIETNNDWRAAVNRDLIAKGYSALAIDTAIGKYLRGDPLTTQERALVDIALASVGTPPSPPPPAANAPDTTTPPYVPAGPAPKGGPGTVDTPTTAYQGSYFGLPGDKVAFDPSDPILGRYGVWQTGVYTPAPAGWRDYALGILRQSGVLV